MKKIHLKLSLLSLSLCAAYQISHAETTKNELETIQVIERSNITEQNSSYSTSSMSSATGMELSAKETPQSVSVITQKRLQDQGIHSVDEALRNTTGVNVIHDSLKTRFQSRGFYVDQIGEDGITINVAGRSGWSDKIDIAPSTDLAVYDHIEVVRGATGLTQSNSEPGGTVNLIRKRPTAEFQHLGEISLDRWGSQRNMLDVSGSLNKAKTIRGRIVGLYEKNDSFKERVKGYKKLIYATGEMDLGDSAMLTLGAMHQASNEVPDYAGVMLPCDVGEEDRQKSWLPQCNQPVELPRDTYKGTNWSNLQVKKNNFFTKFHYFFANDWKLGAEASYTETESVSKVGQFFTDSRAWPGVAAELSPGWYDYEFSKHMIKPFRYDKKDKQYGIKLDLSGQYSAFNQKHDFYFGYTYNDEDIRSNYIKVPNLGFEVKRWNPGKGSCIDFDHYYSIVGFRGDEVAEPDWGLYDNKGEHLYNEPSCANAKRGNLIYRQYDYNSYYNSSKTHGVTLSTRLNFGEQWHLLAGVRYSHYHLKQIKELDVMYGEHKYPRSDYIYYSDSKGHKYIPYAALSYDLTQEQSVYASYTQIFKPQDDSDESHRHILPPTTGTNYELGWKAALRDNRLHTSVALFRIEHKNRAITQYDYINWQTYASPVGRVISQGVDAEISGDITENWNIFVGYTYNKSEYKQAEGYLSRQNLNFSRHTPVQMLRLYTTYHFPTTKWSVGGGLSAQTSTSSLYDIQQGGYTLWNAHIQYDFSKNGSVSLIGANLTDKKYFENNPNRMRGINNFYGTPLTWVLKLNWRF